MKFKYERLPIFCHFCGLLGHDLNHCAGHFAAEKYGDEIDYQYGDWLRASSGWHRSPSRNGTAGPKQRRRRSEYHGVDGDPRDIQADDLGINLDVPVQEKRGREVLRSKNLSRMRI